MDEMKDLNHQYEALEEDIKEIISIRKFIEDGVLEFSRTQYYGDNGWITSEYTLVTGCGGPHVEFTTNYSIHVYWGGKVIEMQTQDQEVRDKIDKIEKYLDDHY